MLAESQQLDLDKCNHYAVFFDIILGFGQAIDIFVPSV
jgi:hypothetical protein